MITNIAFKGHATRRFLKNFLFHKWSAAPGPKIEHESLSTRGVPPPRRDGQALTARVGFEARAVPPWC